ncbi:MAG: hypothetical protein JO303_07990 [Caulobacteraceae bacterium]|nr:hypothetical protein [Caulobacteraceae bacterium]
MQKLFEIVPRRGAWDVVHNHVGFRRYPEKREAIRVALLLGRMQLRLADEAEVVLRDGSGAPRARRHYSPDGGQGLQH